MRGGMGQRLSSSADVKYDLSRLSRESIAALKYSLKGSGLTLLYASLLTVAIAATSVAAPLLTRRAIDNHISFGDWSGLLFIMLLYIVIVGLEWMASYGQTLLAHRVAYAAITRLRTRAFAHIMQLDIDFHHDSKVGHSTSLVMNDTETLFSLISQGFVYFISDLVTIAAIFVTLLSLSPRLALVITFTMPLTILGTQVIGRLVRFAQRQVRQEIADLTVGVEQNISGAKDVKAFAQEGRQVAKVAELSRAAKDAHIKSAKASSLMFPMMDLTSAIGLGAVIWQGGLLYSRGEISFGILTAALLYVRRIHGPLMDLSQVYTTYQTAAAALDRIATLLRRHTKVAIPEEAEAEPDASDIKVSDVSFGYSRPDVLCHVIIDIPAGSRVAIIGESGSGKSTLVKLLGRLHDPREGQISFGGSNLRDISPEVLRRRIQIIPQDTYLFPMTVWQNITYGIAEADRQSVSDLAEQLGLTQFFLRLKDGLDTVVSEGGKSLSGGQRQAVAILRALIRNPDVIILDEAASHLDSQIEQVVYKNMESLWRGKTIIIVTHRTTSLGLAEKIYEVASGQVREVQATKVRLAGWQTE